MSKKNNMIELRSRTSIIMEEINKKMMFHSCFNMSDDEIISVAISHMNYTVRKGTEGEIHKMFGKATLEGLI